MGRQHSVFSRKDFRIVAGKLAQFQRHVLGLVRQIDHHDRAVLAGPAPEGIHGLGIRRRDLVELALVQRRVLAVRVQQLRVELQVRLWFLFGFLFSI